MSWNFTGSGENRDEALASVAKQIAENPHIPDDRKDALNAAAIVLAGSYPDPSLIKRIGTNGHINPDGTGNLAVRVET